MVAAAASNTMTAANPITRTLIRLRIHFQTSVFRECGVEAEDLFIKNWSALIAQRRLYSSHAWVIAAVRDREHDGFVGGRKHPAL